jgi:large subunit ribosomal protein L19
MNKLIQELETPLMKTKLPDIQVGDSVKVFVKIKEGGKERTQGYEGVIVKRRGEGISQTITVRRVFQGIGIERAFMVHSPRIEKITVQRRGNVRRAKLYYLRKRAGKATRIKEKVGMDVGVMEAADVAPPAATPAPDIAPAEQGKAEEQA